MPIRTVTPEEWMIHTQENATLVFDVRSPGEYCHAHIPNALSLPLFSDDERAKIGTLYKQTSREAAIKEGLQLFGPRMRLMVETVESLAGNPANPKEAEIYIHCWRGGMRSMAVAWLLDLYGFRVSVLEGGYKAFRNWVLNQFTLDHPICIVGGYTGAGKTKILKAMHALGQSVIDLEELASHKGSAFGNIGMPPQPSQEMFENKLAAALFRLRRSDQIWIEDESQRIGDVNIPGDLWSKLIEKKVYFLEIPFEVRLQNILEEYGQLDRERLVHAVIRIRKRLGGLQTQQTIQYLIDDNITGAFDILLKYYDTFYKKSMSRKVNPSQQYMYLKPEGNDPVLHARHLIQNS